TGTWDGVWETVNYQVPETERALREGLRNQLAWPGLLPHAPTLSISPHDRTASLRRRVVGHATVRLGILRPRSEGPAADRDMAGRAWDLAGLDRDYAALLGTYRPRLEAYRRGLPGREALVERMRLVHDYRRFPFRDPDLPPELLPEGWSGRAAHEV